MSHSSLSSSRIIVLICKNLRESFSTNDFEVDCRSVKFNCFDANNNNDIFGGFFFLLVIRVHLPDLETHDERILIGSHS